VTIDIRLAEPGPLFDQLFREILVPSFPPDELCTYEDVRRYIGNGQPAWVAVDESGEVVGGAVSEWDPERRVMLLAWLAIRPGQRGSGIGGRLLEAAMSVWRSEYAPCVVLAEVEDPAQHHASELYGDPVLRQRFYLSRGARILDLPYFQAALGPGLSRVAGVHLMVLHIDPPLQGAAVDTVDATVLRRYLETYQRETEGKVGTDEQARRLWDALDAHPDGVPYVVLTA
jgi:GNAT superfamily N-acetyltransferase